MRILNISADPVLRENLRLVLSLHGFTVEDVASVGEAIDYVNIYEYQCVLLHDSELCPVAISVKELRCARHPIIVLTGSRTSNRNIPRIAACLNAGADDVIPFDCETSEIIARIHAVARRSAGHPDSVITVENCTINLTTHSVTVDDHPLLVTPRMYQLLELLALNLDRTVTHDQIMYHLYVNGGAERRIIDVFICKIRKMFKNAGCVNIIETSWGYGYVMRSNAKPAQRTCRAIA